MLRRPLLRLLTTIRRGRAEADLAREIDAHLQLLEDRFVAQGMTAEDARSAARRAFGGVEQVKEHQRAARSFRWMDGCWVDVRLGVRLLLKYPGLTVVAGFGIAVAIAIATLSYAVFYSALHPTLPLDEGGRIVGVENWDTAWNNQEDRNLHDFARWRRELTSLQDLSAFAIIERNLVGPDGRAEAEPIAQMTASGFRVARVPPLHGRPLLDEDERKGAPPVVVLGHDVWRRRFASDPQAVGRTVRLGNTPYAIVGVMPEHFGFPINNRLWIPLPAEAEPFERRRGPKISVFGRLAPEATLDAAQAELTAFGQRMAAEFPDTHGRLRPRIVRYTELWFDDGPRSQLHVVQFLITLLIVVVGVNVAILVYARTGTRQAEIAVRTALGASRSRIVGQLFVEALVLSLAAAVLGLAIARLALWQLNETAQLFGGASGERQVFTKLFSGLPFWVTFRISTGTVLYAFALAALAAAIAGVLPALQATGRRVQTRLAHLGGSTGLRLGSTWTTLIVVQVAFAVAVLPAALFTASRSFRLARADPGFPAAEFLMARVAVDRDAFASADADAYSRETHARYQERLAELMRRVQAEPDVAAVTVTSTEPGDEPSARIESEGGPRPADPAGHRVRHLDVGVGFFDAFDVPLLLGRTFRPADVGADATSGSRPIVVNRTFAQEILLGVHPLGRRIRYIDRNAPDGDARPWFEIVGVVEDIPAQPISDEETQARLYHPMAPGESYGTQFAVRARTGSLDAIAARLPVIAAALDPALRVREMMPLTDLYRQEQMGLHWAATGLALVTLSTLLLSAAGVYALMSVTVTRRRKEIGIRIALGADRSRLLRSIFARALWQLALGAVVGAAAAILLDHGTQGEMMGGDWMLLLAVVAVIITAVGVLAALGPARRGLRIQPTEALRDA